MRRFGLATVLGMVTGAWAPNASGYAQTPSAAPSSEPAPQGSDPELTAQARADVETLLTDRGKAYLDARARLEADPATAVPALLDRLAHKDSLDPAQERRLHAVLGGMAGPALAPEHARLLRASLLSGEGPEPWADLLASTEPGRRALTSLIGDRDLALEQRGTLLDVLVASSPAPELESMLDLVGRGHPSLSDRLWRAMVSRGHATSNDAAFLARAVRTRLERTPSGPALQRAKWVSLYAQLAPNDDPDFAEMLSSVAADDALAFEIRFAALRGLGQAGAPSHDVLRTLATRHLAEPDPGVRSQADVILGWQALSSLAEVDPAGARSLIDSLDLRHDPAPRVAALAWRHSELAPGTATTVLDDAMGDPWPEVQAAALRRIQGPCERSQLGRLAQIAGPVSRGGTREGMVGRAAVQAIGRCESPAALRTLRGFVEDDGVPFDRRGAAARALIEADPEQGTTFVAKVLATADPGALAETLADALSQAPPEYVGPSEIDALCRVGERHPNAARAARRAIEALAPGTVCDG